MKKSLIALAVLTSVAGLAQAQSSVSVYGIVDAVVHKDKGVSAELTSGGVSGSRLGFKGTEDLGGGLKANFLLEHGFNVDTGTQRTAGSSFDRQAYVGLSGGFGEVKLGNVYTAYDDISGNTNPVFDSVLAPTIVWAEASTGYNSNPTNNLYYATPSMGGVSAALSANLKEGGESVSAFNVTYNGGPVYAGVAYQKEGETKFTRLNGSYDLGAAKLLAGYGNVKAGSAKTTDLTFGADVPLSANLTLSAGYASSKADGEERASGLGLGAAYSLSKRTTVYGGFLDTKNAGPDTRYGVGVKHAF
ncbi:MAG: porin [Hydrogenophaga sp.]